MCLTLYVGTTTDIPLIPWDKEKPAFYVKIVSGKWENAAVHHFSSLKVHFLGSNEGCGCGFRQITDFKNHAEEKQINHDALVRYLEKLPPQKSPIQIYCCWGGDEEQPALTNRQISLAEISKPEFFFREREMLTIV